jgi:hypothetical protein
MDTRVARRLHVSALRLGPVLVVTARNENLMVLDQVAAAIAIDAGRVADVVAVRLEPTNHRVLCLEYEVFRA